jgi:hypothetical protein
MVKEVMENLFKPFSLRAVIYPDAGSGRGSGICRVIQPVV